MKLMVWCFLHIFILTIDFKIINKVDLVFFIIFYIGAFIGIWIKEDNDNN